MADIMVEVFARGYNMEPTLVYDADKEIMVEKKVERTVKFSFNFENTHEKALTIQDIKDLFARQIVNNPFEYTKGKSIYFAPRVIRKVTQDKALDLGIIKKKQKNATDLIIVNTGEFKRGRREITTMDRVYILKKGDIVEIILDKFDNVQCSRCGDPLTQENSVCLGYNECVCLKHLKSFIDKYGYADVAVRQYKIQNRGFA